MGPTIGVSWRNGIESTHKPSTKLWLDHSISAWCTNETQWHLNEYTAITMLNTPSLRRTFRGFCENNKLSTVLYKYMEADGTMKPQYVTGDNGIEHDHKVAMALHK
eukprot:5896961-Amphidinium_carterae.1